jgi:hypothetical protein
LHDGERQGGHQGDNDRLLHLCSLHTLVR